MADVTVRFDRSPTSRAGDASASRAETPKGGVPWDTHGASVADGKSSPLGSTTSKVDRKLRESSNQDLGTTRGSSSGEKRKADRKQREQSAAAYLASTRVPSRQGHRTVQAEPKGHLNVKITSVPDIYSHTRTLVGMIANVWGWSRATTTLFRQIVPGLAKVHCGNETYIVPGFLLQDLDTLNLVPTMPNAASSLHGQIAVSNAHVAEVRVRHASPYFPQVIVLLKLRWLLRLHSACCELDYKMCSLRHLILGLQYVVLQQHAEAPSDNIFDSKVSHSAGAHLNLESVLDDVADQLHRAMGSAWRGFLEFVATCDATRAVHSSAMELAKPQIVSNDGLAGALDIVFIANFLRQPRASNSGRLRELFEDLEALGMPVPDIPPLRKAENLRAWSKALSRPTRQAGEKVVSKKDLEKLAQLDAVLLTAAVELHLPEVIATPEEALEMDPVATTPASSEVAPPRPVEIGSTGRSLGSAAPPAARVILVDAPQASPVVIAAALICVHHHLTFPSGIRERLYNLLAEEYGLSRENSERLAIAATQNIDGKRLPEATLLEMEAREKERQQDADRHRWLVHADEVTRHCLRNAWRHGRGAGGQLMPARVLDYGVKHHRDTSHLLVSPLVAAPVERGKPAKYTLPHRGSFQHSSMPELRRPAEVLGDTLGREPFKVPLQTGPLTMDFTTRKFRTTGLFMRMPPLK